MTTGISRLSRTERRERRNKKFELRKREKDVSKRLDLVLLTCLLTVGAGVNTTNTDKSMESLKDEIIARSALKRRRRTRSGEVKNLAASSRGYSQENPTNCNCQEDQSRSTSRSYCCSDYCFWW